MKGIKMPERFFTRLLSLPSIDIPPGRRQPDKQVVKRLAASIKEIGLQQPISVRRPVKGQYQLIAGLHRLEAVRSLGKGSILASVVTCDDTAARLWEISENLHRKDLTPDERAAHTELIESLIRGMSPGREKTALLAALDGLRLTLQH
jgi:ParB family chromosome partitioning protein